ncbi:hypothetical protein ACFYUR_09855 [Micromonospora haikouensis]|uniref:hypothetical protein n=1 Tax=Micromonospora haikouensis TaxID=686309 RepID=UPI0036B8C104
MDAQRLSDLSGVRERRRETQQVGPGPRGTGRLCRQTGQPQQPVFDGLRVPPKEPVGEPTSYGQVVGRVEEDPRRLPVGRLAGRLVQLHGLIEQAGDGVRLAHQGMDTGLPLSSDSPHPLGWPAVATLLQKG